MVKYNRQLNTVLITWIRVYGAAGYQVTRTGGSTGTLVGYSRSNDWTDPLPWGISSPTTFTYAIVPMDEGGNLAATSTTLIYTTASTPLMQ